MEGVATICWFEKEWMKAKELIKSKVVKAFEKCQDKGKKINMGWNHRHKSG